MVIIGLVMEHKGNNESQLIVKRENARVTQQAGEAIERAGNAEREAQGFRLKADELEAQLRGINPSNVPLASVIAYVAIEYKTNSVQTNEWDFFMQIESNVPPRMTLAIGDRFDQINLIAKT